MGRYVYLYMSLELFKEVFVRFHRNMYLISLQSFDRIIQTSDGNMTSSCYCKIIWAYNLNLKLSIEVLKVGEPRNIYSVLI